MKSLLPISMIILLLFQCDNIFAQQPELKLVLSRDKNYGDKSYYNTITDIKQDPRGYIWLSTALKGLQRYDGTNLLSIPIIPMIQILSQKTGFPAFI